MTDISKTTYERNGIETIVDNDGILWLSEKHIEEEVRSQNIARNYSKILFRS